MATGQLIQAGSELPLDASRVAQARSHSTGRVPLGLASALLVIVLYAAFAHGAVALAVDTRIQIAVGVLAALGAAAWLGTGSLRFSAPGPVLLAVGLLGAFAIWSGVTLFWSVAADQTWLELNRALTYVLVLCLAIAIGASDGRSLELVAYGFLAIALAVTAYGLGQKLLPGLHVAGLFNLNQTGPLPRLQEPLGYWNALGLFVAMGVPIALAVAVNRARSRPMRIGALAAIELMVLVIAFTYSRGGLLALVIALAVGVAVSSARLRSLMWLTLAVIAAVPPLVFGLTNHSLTAAGISLSSRESAGGILAAVLIASLLVLIVAARHLLTLEQTVHVGPARSRAIGRVLGAAVCALVIVGLLALAVSSRGLTGSVSHVWKSFTTTRVTSNYDPNRLLSADSENRWVWWKEAAGAFSARPVGGWGAGSFGVVHLLYRRDSLSVQQPHSVPLQFLAETGIVGTLLAMAGLALLVLGAIRVVWRQAPGPQRVLAAGVLAGGVAYAIHLLYDWDWDITAVTVPALLFLGVLCGTRWPTVRGPAQNGEPPARSAEPSLARTPRLLWLGGVTLWLCTFALSAALPSLAASKANSVLVNAATSSPATLEHLHSSAVLASRLDPLSDAGMRAEATVAFHAGRTAAARTYLIEAVRRDPTDALTWVQLEFVEALLKDNQDAVRAGRRAIELDPRGTFAASAGSLNLLLAPPQSSATARPTPRVTATAGQ